MEDWGKEVLLMAMLRFYTVNIRHSLTEELALQPVELYRIIELSSVILMYMDR